MSYLINLSIFKRNPKFTLLYVGQFMSFFGTMVTSVALPYQIYHRTHSTLMVGLLSLFQLLPLLVTALIGGVFADRYHRRMLLLISEGLLAIGCLCLMWNASVPDAPIALLFIIASIMSGITGLHRPALDSLVQQIVRKEDFSAVGSVAMFKATFCMIAGPAIGGLLVASAGLVVTYFLDFLTFLVSLFAIWRMGALPKPVMNQPDLSTFSALKESFRYAMSRQELIGTYVVDFVAMIFGMPSALFPAIAQQFGGAAALGCLYSAPGVGALILSIFSGWTHKVTRHGAAIAIAAGLWGVSIILFGLASNFYAALFFLALAGAFDGVSGIFRSTMWNETIPNELRGRMSGIEMISYLSGPKLGDTEAGIVAAMFGVTASIVSGGVICVVGVLASCCLLPRFWFYRSTVHHAEQAEIPK